MSKRLTLEHAGLRVVLSPQHGAALLSLQSCEKSVWREWLVAEDLAATIAVPPCFPLIPFANRIAHGRLELETASRPLAANRPDLSVHPIHGYAWEAPWSVDQQRTDSLQLSYDGSNDPWPWQYRAQLDVKLAADEVQLHMQVINLGRAAMPAGLGLHPAFPTKNLESVKASTTAFLPVNGASLPSAYLKGASECVALATGNLPGEGVDSDFDGWAHRARLQWSDRVLELAVDPVFAALHLFRPAKKPLICLEPVTHLTGAMAAERLPHIPTPCLLNQGEALEGSVIFRLLPYGD